MSSAFHNIHCTWYTQIRHRVAARICGKHIPNVIPGNRRIYRKTGTQKTFNASTIVFCWTPSNALRCYSLPILIRSFMWFILPELTFYASYFHTALGSLQYLKINIGMGVWMIYVCFDDHCKILLEHIDGWIAILVHPKFSCIVVASFFGLLLFIDSNKKRWCWQIMT